MKGGGRSRRGGSQASSLAKNEKGVKGVTGVLVVQWRGHGS